MTDIIDTANDIAQQTIERAIANAPKFDRPSRLECVECGETIPEQRRQIGGVTLCIDCQTYNEHKAKNYAKK